MVNDNDNGVNILAILRQRRRLISIVTIGVTVVVAVYVGFAYRLQPRKTVVSLTFRPAFSTASLGAYPNRSPYAPTDVIAPVCRRRRVRRERDCHVLPADGVR